MNRLALPAIGPAPAPLATFLAVVLAAFVSPAQAQDGGERVNMVIVYGDDACPRSTGDEIVVCPRLDESERYRIPPNLRLSDSPENTAWAERVRSIETIGAFGAMSCSPSGGGGWTGCTQKLIDAAYEEKRTGSDALFGQLIEEERQKRLSTIDEDAAAEQARVEAIERDYMERLERESEGELPGDQQLPAVDSAPDDEQGS
jgi:hypothetical protein